MIHYGTDSHNVVCSNGNYHAVRVHGWKALHEVTCKKCLDLIEDELKMKNVMYRMRQIKD